MSINFNTLKGSCGSNTGPCKYSCDEIETKLSAKISGANVYTKAQIDAYFSAMQALINSMLNANYASLSGLLVERPVASAQYNGRFFLATDSSPPDLFLCLDSNWELVVRASDYISDELPDMRKEYYDNNDDGFIDISAGGLGADFSAESGTLKFNNGATQVDHSVRVNNAELSADLTLNINSAAYQILNSSVIRSVNLPSATYPMSFKFKNTGTANLLIKSSSLTIATLLPATNIELVYDGSLWQIF